VGGVPGDQQLLAVALRLELLVVDAPGEVAARALRGEQLGAGERLGVLVRVGHLGVLLLRLEPGLELVHRQGDHPLPHVGVRQAAELGALPDVGAGLVGVDQERVDATGHRVHLAVQRRDPERVDDVVRGDLEVHVDAGGDHQVVGGDDVALAEGAVAVGVVLVLPPPLLADHPDGEVVLVDVLDVEQRPQGEEAHDGEDDRRQERPGDLQPGVAVGLGGQLVVALPAPEPDDDEQRAELHEEEDDDGDGEDAVPEVVDRPGEGTLRPERVLRRVRGAGAEQQRQRQHQRQASAAQAARRGGAGGPLGTGLHAVSLTGRTRGATAHDPTSTVTGAAGGAGSAPSDSAPWSPSCSSNSRVPATPAATPTPMAMTAPATSSPTTTLGLIRGREAMKNPTPTITTPTPRATHTGASADTARNTRDSAQARTARDSAAAAGCSFGAMIRLRIRRLTSGSPVARSAQVWTVHSTRTTPITTRPATNRIASVTSPITTRATPKAATGGQ